MRTLPCFGNIDYYVELVQLKDQEILVHNELVDRKVKRNRYEIITPKGKQLVSIPIKKPRDRKELLKVEIVNEEAWQRDQWRAIQTAYNRAPFFEFYDYKFESLFHTPFNSLKEFNLQALKSALAALKINKEVRFIDEVYPLSEGDGKLSFPPYNQVFSEKLPFLENACILDLIFNLGPDAKNYLEAVCCVSE